MSYDWMTDRFACVYVCVCANVKFILLFNIYSVLNLSHMLCFFIAFVKIIILNVK